jgi:hypothetical protein
MPWYKIPHFPPSKMPINYLYARNIKEFLLFMPGIYTKDLRYLGFIVLKNGGILVSFIFNEMLKTFLF